MQRVLEIVFSRWLQLAALFFVPLVIAIGVVYAQPRQYQASATIWALGRYTVVGVTGPESDLTSTPAETQTIAITEILQTKTFALTIAHEANLASTFDKATQSNPATLDSAMYTDISTHVQATAVGYNLISITYENKSQTVAQSVIKAVVQEYGISASQFAVSESKQLLLIYQTQLQQAQAASKQATSAAQTYLREHPGTTAQQDSQYSDLQTSATNAQATVTNIQSTINDIKNEVATIGPGSNTLFTIVDAPALGFQPVSRMKSLLTGGGIGLAVGLLFCIAFVVIVMRRDRAIYSVSDLQKITEAPILMQIPQMSHRLLTQTVERLDAIEQFF